jgi:hypothetical protein
VGLLESIADSTTRLIPAHFPNPTSVRIVRTEDGFRVLTD